MKSSSVQKSLISARDDDDDDNTTTTWLCIVLFIQRTAIYNNKKIFCGFPLQHLDYCHPITTQL